MSKEESLIWLRNRILCDYDVHFHYSRKCHCLYGVCSVIPDGIRQLINFYGCSYFRFEDGSTYVH